METIDAFFEQHQTPGYKFEVDSNGNVFIVEVEEAVHEIVVAQLNRYFDVPNGGVIVNQPIEFLVNPSKRNSYGLLGLWLVVCFIRFLYPPIAHYRPRGGKKTLVSDIAVYPSLNIIPKLPPPQRTLQFGDTTHASASQ